MRYPVLFAIMLISADSFSQKDAAIDIYKKTDTIEAYINMQISSGPNGYFVNEKSIDKRTYDRYKTVMDKMDKCLPCWIKNYTLEGEFVSEGMYYTDCLVGNYVEYYPNGNKKLSGHYKENHTGTWEDLYQRGYCSVKEGVWIYHNESGKISKREHYKDGKPVN